MNHEELFNCVAIVTTVSFFGLIAEMDNRGVKNLLPLPDSHEPAVKSEYKSPFYKLWQYVKKNNPSTHNDHTVHSYNEKYSHTQRLFSLDQYPLEKIEKSENDIKQSALTTLQKWLSFKSNFSFCKHNNYHIDWILAYVKTFLKRKQIYIHTGYSKLKNLTSYIHQNTVWQQSEKLRKLHVCIKRSFHHWVCEL
ncbi:MULTISPECIES: hypothetical protein [unclassified Bartonella]|uniref:hypothetical protein n=1 Tax=unclassified Bartonella TaxID=2645622 RepID=UPI00235EFEF8|nr:MULTISPECIES: hypothetical protein [unclassified Bartonella]